MNKEEKELLLKDLSARLFYGLYATVRDPEEKDDFQPFEVLGIKEDLVWVKNIMIGVDHFDTIEVVKPYLRPMSSMTEEEKKEFSRISGFVVFGDDFDNEVRVDDMAYIDKDCFNDSLDFLLKHHIDFRGLIEKGLALEAPKDMYKS